MSLGNAKHMIDDAFTRTELRGLSYESAFAGATSLCGANTPGPHRVDLAVTGVALIRL